MLSTKVKKMLSCSMSVVMIFTIFSFVLTSFAAATTYPVMEAYTAASSGDYHKYYNKVFSVTFSDFIDFEDIESEDTLEYWDVSQDKDESVIAWMKLNKSATDEAGDDRFDVYIAGDGGVGANPSSEFVFYGFSVLENVYGSENFKVSDATSMRSMFENCSKLKNVTFTDWDTSNVTDMSSMFRNCKSLTELDLSSFDTSKVTTIRFMFYLCEQLEYIYVGDGWTTEAIANIYDGVFNCCYAIFGGKNEYDKNYNYFTGSADYAKLKSEGGHLTHISEKPQPEKKEYTVTYEFTGDIIPEGVNVVQPVKYEEGSLVSVEDVPAAEGYRFSGWSSEDADISNGSFTINQDVKIVGSWEKLYKINYKFTGEVPEGVVAPEASYAADGETVIVSAAPYADGYVFVGWNTEDADVTNGSFVMPENDVTLYGYFKKPVGSVEINGGDIVLNKGDETVINVIVKPEDATVKEIIFESSDETVIKVDENGNVTAVGEGTATVTVTSKDDETKKDSITVTVKIPVTDITVDKDSLTLNKNTTQKINAVIVPEDATNKKIIYTSSDESIAVVDEDGNITAVGEGKATITVKAEDDFSVYETVEVTVKVPVTTVTATDDFTLNIGEEKNVEASVNADATNKELIYESDNPGVIKVDSNGNVSAVGEGTATITVTSKDDPSKKTQVNVTVKIPVEDIVADKDEITLDIGESDKINITVNPDSATDKEVEFESSDKNVVTVDKDGNITAVGEGTATITVTSKDDPSKKVQITVTVTEVPEINVPVTNITAPDDFTLVIGEEKNVGATVNSDATNKELIYSSSDKTVVTVDENGNVKAIGEGTATVTIVSAENPEIKKTVVVTAIKPEYVINAPDSITVIETESKNLGVTVSPSDGAPAVIYTSADESIVKVDADGNITGISAGTTTITADIGNGRIKVITVTVTALPVPAPLPIPTKYHIAFGKTDGIGWYEVSVNGGDFFPQGPNSTLEVEKGSVIVVRVQDMWIDDDFTFYVNGNKVEKDAANCITLTVDGYMLIGALSMDVNVPDIDESLSLLQKIINAIKAFFDMIASWFE